MKNIILLITALSAMPSVAQVEQDEFSFWDGINLFLTESRNLGVTLKTEYGNTVMGIMAIAAISISLIRLFLAQGNETEVIIRKLIDQILKIILILVFYANFFVIFGFTMIWIEGITVKVSNISGGSGHPIKLIINTLFNLLSNIGTVIWDAIWGAGTGLDYSSV